MVGVLEKEECLNRSRAVCLENIRNLNVWGSSLHDISIIKNLINLEVLNLSVNDVHSLQDLSHCPRIKEIYLRRNKIHDLEEIKFLKNLPNLHILWLADNPCTQNENYKYTVIRNLPNLVKLDSCTITEEDREMAKEEGILFDEDENLPDYDGLELDKTLTTTFLKQFFCKQKAVIEEKPLQEQKIEEKYEIVREPQIHSLNGEVNVSIHNFNSTISNETQELESSTQTIKSNALSAILLLLNDLNKEELCDVKEQTEKLILLKSKSCAKSLLID